jgi:hypothetical protein
MQGISLRRIRRLFYLRGEVWLRRRVLRDELGDVLYHYFSRFGELERRRLEDYVRE